MAEPHDRIQCTAHSKQTGAQCRNSAILGGTVCRNHGGAAPQVANAAMQRIYAMVSPALAQLAYLVDSAESDAVKLNAVKDVLDRAGLKPVDQSKVNVSGEFKVSIGTVSDRG